MLFLHFLNVCFRYSFRKMKRRNSDWAVKPERHNNSK